jgi:hypothetical protein
MSTFFNANLLKLTRINKKLMRIRKNNIKKRIKIDKKDK